MTDRRFPDGFVWGVATAGHQNEGDKTTSDTWFLELLQSTIFSEPSGRACNTWENEPNLPEMLSWAGFTGVRPRPGAGDPAGGELDRRGRAVPRRQRHAAGGLRRHEGRDDRRPTRGPDNDQEPPRRPAGRPFHRNHRRRGAR